MDRTQRLTAGALTALVGFTSTFTVVLAGLRAAGASQAQAASGLLTVSVLMGVLGIGLSVRHRQPISIAWSTPGAALLVAGGTPRGGFPAAVGAFAVCGLLVVVTGAVPRLRVLVLSVPRAITNALLAGVLLELCVVPVSTVVHSPRLAVPIVATWLVLTRFARRWAVPAAMAVAVVEIVAGAGGAHLGRAALAPGFVVTAPAVSVQALTLGLSLFAVTMASQNVPGIAVLESFGYEPPVRAVLVQSGLGTVAGAVFGGHVLNLAAISAALCAGPAAGADRSRRWVASSFAAGCYIVLGLSAGLLSALVAVAPAGLVETVAGLALLGTLGAALAAATADGRVLADGGHREAAVVTFLVTVSGITLAGIGSAFWGLVVGLALIAAFARRAAGDRPR